MVPSEHLHDCLHGCEERAYKKEEGSNIARKEQIGRKGKKEIADRKGS
jgi:hypothetical protein